MLTELLGIRALEVWPLTLRGGRVAGTGKESDTCWRDDSRARRRSCTVAKGRSWVVVEGAGDSVCYLAAEVAGDVLASSHYGGLSYRAEIFRERKPEVRQGATAPAVSIETTC
jgi:hypothetical protein